MSCNLMIKLGFVVMMATTMTAQSSGSSFGERANPRGGPLDLGPTINIYDLPSAHPELYPLKERQQAELVSWGKVGRCVAAKDREASASYVAAKVGSLEANALGKRLEHAFDSCLSGSGISAKSNEPLRRAAIADALGIRAPE